MWHWLIYKLKRCFGFNRRQRVKEARREALLRSQADYDLWHAALKDAFDAHFEARLERRIM